MQKIGILTYFNEYTNLGTNMQAYCTLKAVQRASPDECVELVDYSKWLYSKHIYLSDISLQSLKDDYRRCIKYNNFFKRELTFSPKKLRTPDYRAAVKFLKNQNYHTIYVGSDTVLQLDPADADTLTAFWLDPVIPGRKVLVAASANGTTYDSLSQTQKTLIQNSIDQFSLLGVRDDATFRLLTHFTRPGDERLQLIPDPTFTYEIDYEHIEGYFRRKGMRFNKPVVCLHLLRNSCWGKELADNFRKAGYIVASLRPAHYADIVFSDLSPFEQMGIYRYFKFVVTHRFHDCIFCLKNLTPVLVFPQLTSDVTPRGESKYKSLCDLFSLSDEILFRDAAALSAKTIFDMHRAVMGTFHNKVQAISSKLVDLRQRYESFVMQSREVTS